MWPCRRVGPADTAVNGLRKRDKAKSPARVPGVLTGFLAKWL